VQAPQQPRKPTRVTQLPAAIMKNGQLSTEMTSVESSDGVIDDVVEDAADEEDEDDDWTAVDDGGETTAADADDAAAAALGETRTRCV